MRKKRLVCQGVEGAKRKAGGPVEWQLALTGSSMVVHETLPHMYVDVNFSWLLRCLNFSRNSARDSLLSSPISLPAVGYLHHIVIFDALHSDPTLTGN